MADKMAELWMAVLRGLPNEANGGLSARDKEKVIVSINNMPEAQAQRNIKYLEYPDTPHDGILLTAKTVLALTQSPPLPAASAPGPIIAEAAAMAERLERVERMAFKRPRSPEEPGMTSGTVRVSVMGVSEVQAWDEHVQDKGVPCSIAANDSLVSPPRMVLAALRWLWLLAVSAPGLTLTTHFKSRKSADEVPWHIPLRYIYQAAAAGQPDIDFAAEDKNQDDSAREDLRGLVRGIPCAPQEAKREYALADSSDGTGIRKNKAGWAKLLKCICAKYASTSHEHLVTLASRIEAVWVGKFTFKRQCQQQAQQDLQQDQQHSPPSLRQQDQQHSPPSLRQQDQQGTSTLPVTTPGTSAQPSTSALPGTSSVPGISTLQAQCTYTSLESVQVSPGFPWNKTELPQGVICTNISKALDELLQAPGSTLADLLARASAGTNTAAPAGFVLLVQYVDKLCNMFEIQTARPEAAWSSSMGGAPEPVQDLSGAEVVYLGAKSLVLRLPGADSVLKVSASCAIQRELDIHRVIDPKGCASLRPLLGLRHGTVEGVGTGLQFLELQHWCQPVSANKLAIERIFPASWLQAEAAVQQLHDLGILHRDIKPANFLTHNGRLILNDFDASCHSHEVEERRTRRVGTPAYWSPRCDAEIPGWQYSTDDDWMALALTFATWLGVYSPCALAAAAAPAAASAKLGAVRTLLRPGFHESLPGAFQQRMAPVVALVDQALEQRGR